MSAKADVIEDPAPRECEAPVSSQIRVGEKRSFTFFLYLHTYSKHPKDSEIATSGASHRSQRVFSIPQIPHSQETPGAVAFDPTGPGCG